MIILVDRALDYQSITVCWTIDLIQMLANKSYELAFCLHYTSSEKLNSMVDGLALVNSWFQIDFAIHWWAMTEGWKQSILLLMFNTMPLQVIMKCAYLKALMGNVSKSIGNGVYVTPNVDPGRGAYFLAMTFSLALNSDTKTLLLFIMYAVFRTHRPSSCPYAPSCFEESRHMALWYLDWRSIVGLPLLVG